MRRREFITLLSSAAVTWPSATRAEQSPVPVIGLLGSGAAAAQSEWTAAFLQRLRELGWSEGRNIIIDYRWGEGHSERFSEIASEFVTRAISGRLFAASKEDGGSDAAELARVYPFPAPVETVTELRTRLALADERLTELKAMLEDMRRDRDAWREQAQTRLLPAPAAPTSWWRWLRTTE